MQGLDCLGGIKPIMRNDKTYNFMGIFAWGCLPLCGNPRDQCVGQPMYTLGNQSTRLVDWVWWVQKGQYHDTYKILMYVDNSTTVNLMPTAYYEQAMFLHHLPKYNTTDEIIWTGNGVINTYFLTDIQLNVQGCLIQLKVLVLARTGILLNRTALGQITDMARLWLKHNVYQTNSNPIVCSPKTWNPARM